MTSVRREVALGRLFRRAKVLGHVDEQMLSVYRDRGVVVKDEALNPNKTAEDRSIYQLVEPGWLVVNRMKAWQGSVGIADVRGIVSGHYICFRPSHEENHRYLHYLLRSPVFTTRFAAISRGVRPGQIEIDNDELAATKLSLPSLENQKRFADFLDDQVARIDNIIVGRRDQLRLLEETRAAEADSTFDVPSHRLVRLALFARVQGGVTVDGGREAAGGIDLPYLRVANVQAGSLDLSEIKSIRLAPDLMSRYLLQDGDVLMTEGRDIDKLGRGTVWRCEVPGAIHQNHVFAVRVDKERLLPAYLAYATACTYARDYFEMTGNRTTNLASTSATKVLDMRLPIRSVEDQARVVRRVAQLDERARIGQAYLTNSIERLAELKRSLITAAVTGEFDVSSADGSRVSIG